MASLRPSPTWDETPPTLKINPLSPVVSPMTLVGQRLSNLQKKALDFQIPMARARSTATRFGNQLKEGNIPRGCLPICNLLTPNPPAHMLLAWNEALKECGQQLTLLLIDYNLNKYEELESALNQLIENEFHSIRQDFNNLPELDSKLKSVRMEIQTTSEKKP